MAAATPAGLEAAGAAWWLEDVPAADRAEMRAAVERGPLAVE